MAEGVGFEPATISATLDTYSHVAPGLQEAAAKKFDVVLENISTKQTELA